MQQNLISAVISPEDKQSILEHLAAVRQLLAPVLIFNLSGSDRQSLAKMGDKSLAFVDKALDYAEKMPELVPPFLNVPEAKKDYTLTADLTEISHEMTILNQSLDDSLMMSAAEAYDASLIFYASARAGLRSNVPGCQTVCDDLANRFPRGKKTKNVPPPAAG